VATVAEDKTGECITLTIYNHVNSSITFAQLQKVFPKSMKIGLKNPYMKITNAGTIVIRNDNPQNIVFEEHSFQNKDLPVKKVKGKKKPVKEEVKEVKAKPEWTQEPEWVKDPVEAKKDDAKSLTNLGHTYTRERNHAQAIRCYH